MTASWAFTGVAIRTSNTAAAMIRFLMVLFLLAGQQLCLERLGTPEAANHS
jgi:hypothetical protein